MKKLEHSMSARRDFRLYLVLLLGAVFMVAGLRLDPARNCDASGRECAPWLVPVAFGSGVLAVVASLALWVRNRKWGSRLDLAQRRLLWWDSSVSSATHGIALDDVARITVQRPSDSNERIVFHDRAGAPLRFPAELALPYATERWARDLVVHFPHIVVDVEAP
ncbi:hypothetical protein [Xanthomonas bundabergensis]|uniref:hypothetical protein n=1 Tax=Xanthomonas bundabergensis TaxID=3160842 RepID=UPI003512578B